MFPEKKSLFLLIAVLLFATALSSCAPPPHCSAEWLVDAINDANSNGAGLDTIDLAPGCVYELGVVDNTVDGNNGLPSITSEIIINGNGATVRRSTGAQKSAIRLFHVSQGGTLTLTEVTLLDGIAMEPPNVTLLIENSGGAVFNRGSLTITNSLLTANRAAQKGGAVYNIGTMAINTSTLQNNEANLNNVPNESGGAILNAGTAAITDSTISGNIASQSGGGIGNSGTMTISNSTISGNSTTLANIASGAAIMNSGTLEIGYTTIANNIGTTSGAVWSATDTLTIYNSIVAYNAPSNCSYPGTSMILGPNLDSDGSCPPMTTADPLLDPLANYGGPTLTHAIPANSPARDAAFGTHPAADQRGQPRPHGSAADLGSYEFSGGGGQPNDPSTISGLVFDDANADGVLDPGEVGFAGVELVLETGPCLAPVSAVSTLTATDGTYQFTVSPPTVGTYCLSIDPLTPPNDTILIPGGFTLPPGGEIEFTLTEGEDLSDLDFGWAFQFAGDLAPNPVITNVNLSATTIAEGGWVEVEVTIENQGAYQAENYELVLIPHYGVGPPNPAGYVVLPTLNPGVPQTETFTPGVLYPTAGTHTLRVLLTDDWYALGDADSTGTNGDYQDFTITVTEPLSFCTPFLELEPRLVILSIREDLMSLPIYVDTDGVPIPGLGPDDPEPYQYSARLNGIPSTACGLQGFEDRLYCTFIIPPGLAGTVAAYNLYLEGCDDPVLTESRILIPDMKPVCSKDLGKDACQAAGGVYVDSRTAAPYCDCP